VSRSRPSYEHTQTGGISWLLAGLGLAFLALSAWVALGQPITPEGGEPAAALAVGGAGALLLLSAAAFHRLRVRDGGEALEIAFGPLPLFARRVPYAAIRSVRPGRTSLIDGWGIHWVPWRGWTWNLSGFTCVVLELEGGRRLRIGTDDPGRLVAWLEARASLRSQR